MLSVDILGREASSEAPLEGVVEEEDENLDLDSVSSQSEEERYPPLLLLSLLPSGGRLLVSLGNVIISSQ